MENNNVVDISDHQDLQDIVRSRIGSDKFVICGYTPNEDGKFNITSYVSDGVYDDEMTYMIQCLKDRREVLFNSED